MRVLSGYIAGQNYKILYNLLTTI